MRLSQQNQGFNTALDYISKERHCQNVKWVVWSDAESLAHCGNVSFKSIDLQCWQVGAKWPPVS